MINFGLYLSFLFNNTKTKFLVNFFAIASSGYPAGYLVLWRIFGVGLIIIYPTGYPT